MMFWHEDKAAVAVRNFELVEVPMDKLELVFRGWEICC